MIEKYNDYKGFIKIDIKDKYNKTISTTNLNNLIVYNGADFLAKACYDPKYKFTHIYGEYGTDSDYTEGSPSGLEVSKEDTVATMRESPRNTTYAESNIIYQSTQASSSNYSGNILTVISSWNSSNLDDKIFVGAGLVCKIASEEYLFSHVYFNGKKKRADESIMITWSIQFN